MGMNDGDELPRSQEGTDLTGVVYLPLRSS